MSHEPHPEHRLTFGVRVERGLSRTVVALQGDVDHSIVPLLQEVLREESGRGRDIVVDLGGVDFVDAAGVGCLASVAAHAHDRGGDAHVVSPSVMAARVIRLLGVAEVLGLSPEAGVDHAGPLPHGYARRNDGARTGAVVSGRPGASPVRGRRWEPAPRPSQRRIRTSGSR